MLAMNRGASATDSRKRREEYPLGSSFIFLLLIVACVLALALVVMATRRLQKEGLTVSDTSKREHFKRSVEEVQRQQRQDHAALGHHADDSKPDETRFSKRGFGKVVESGFAETLEKLNRAIRIEDFQVLGNTDVAETLGRKDVPDYRMVTIYHSELAGRALDVEPSLGLLATQVMVRKDLSDDVQVEFSDPTLLPGFDAHPDLKKVAADLKVKLVNIFKSL